MKETLILKNIRIFDSGIGEFLTVTDLAITGEIISGIGKVESEGSDACQVIDCEGRYAIPGLWECHGHLMDLCADKPTVRSMILRNQDLPEDTDWDGYVQDHLSAFLNHGVTHIRDVGGPLKGMSTLVDSIKSGKRTGPDIRFAGPMLEKPPLHWEMKNRRYPGFTVPIETKKDVDSILDSLKNNGAGLVKTFNKFDQELFAYLAAQARACDLPVTHDPGPLFQWIPMEFAMAHGVNCFEHAQAALPAVLKDDWRNILDEHRYSSPASEQNRTFFRNLMTSAEDPVDEDRLHDFCQQMADGNIRICPTLFTLQSLRTKFTKAPPNEGEAMRRKINAAFCDHMHRLIETMASHGVKILVGHDSSMPGGVALEMGYLNEWGVKPADIIKGATEYPAQWFGVDDRYGKLEVNKMADLVVLDADPLVNISTIKLPWAVFHHSFFKTSNHKTDFLP